MSTALPHEGPSTGEPAPPGFQQRLGLFDATMLVAGTMIGSGIFIVSVDIAKDVASPGWLLVLWILTGVMTVMGALSYAELASMMPKAGGQYVYLREAYSPLWGFQYGWAVFLVIQTGSIAAVAVAFAKFLGVLAPQLGTGDEARIFKYAFEQPLLIKLPLPWLSEPLTIFKRDAFTIHTGQLIAVAIVVFLTFLNCRGVQEGKVIQNTFTLAKTLALIALIVVGLTLAANNDAIKANTTDVWGGTDTTPRYESVSKLVTGPGWLIVLMVAGGAMVGSLFAADAWNNVTFTAGEVRNPERNLGRSLVLGTGLVITLYILANLAYLAVLPVRADSALEKQVRALRERAEKLDEQGKSDEAKKANDEADKLLDEAGAFKRGIAFAKDDRIGTAVMEQWSPNVGASLMAIAIMISTFGCVNGMILMGGRLYYAMARDGLFFRSVGHLNSRGVPAVGMILQGVWAILLIFSGTYSELLDYVIFAALLFYVLTVIGLFILRRTQPNAERPYKVFGYPIVPGLYVFLCAIIMIDLLFVRPEYTWPGLIIVMTGIPVYFLWRLFGRRATA
jgi:APA family basic amino acid/polyamine antiporter